MKLNNIYIILTGVLLFLMTSVSDAQDLIKNTQRGVSTSNMKAPNRVAKEIASVKATIDFESVSPFQMSEKDMRVKHRDYVSEEVYLGLNAKELNKIFDNKRDHITMNIPVSDARGFQVELMKVNILSDGFKVTTSSGKVLYADDFPGIFYRGIIKDDPNSIVSISVFDGQITGLISDDNGNYILGQIKDQPEVYILYNDRDLKVSSNFSCGMTDEMETTVKEVREQHNTKSINSGCIDVYIEADFATYQTFDNSEPNVINFATSLFNQVSTLYANESISVQISDIHVWDTPDPYAVYDSMNGVLVKFTDDKRIFDGNVAHLISTRNLGGGIAWLDELCSDIPHAVSTGMNTSVIPFETYSWNVYVFAHEMGHTFGSPHTHACAWNGNNTQIDDCGNYFLVNNGRDDDDNGIIDDYTDAIDGWECYSYPDGIYYPLEGTIMSYCHLKDGIGVNLNLGFGPQPGDLIRDRYNSASCKTTCAESCPDNISINTTYSSGSNIDIEVSNTITANNKILSGANVDYDAGNLVRLTTGFHAHNGSTFHAFNDGCGGSARVMQQQEIITIATAEKREEEEVSDFTLRNYPNPFTGQTTIEYNLPNDSQVMLVVTDLAGKQIAVLVNREQKTKGVHNISFDGSNYPAGVYYYTIQADEYVGTQKMILVK